jgi:hypothetical protein
MSNRSTKWSLEDDRRLLELKAAGTPLAVIAKKLNRTEGAVDSRISVLKRRADLASGSSEALGHRGIE